KRRHLGSRIWSKGKGSILVATFENRELWANPHLFSSSGFSWLPHPFRPFLAKGGNTTVRADGEFLIQNNIPPSRKKREKDGATTKTESRRLFLLRQAFLRRIKQRIAQVLVVLHHRQKPLV